MSRHSRALFWWSVINRCVVSFLTPSFSESFDMSNQKVTTYLCFQQVFDVKSHLYVILTNDKWPVWRIISGIGKIVCTHIFHGHVHLRRVDLNIIDIFHLAQKWQHMLLGSLARVGGGGVLRISSDRDDRMGAKIKPPKKSPVLQTKPPKIPEPKFNPQKIPRRISKP